MRNNYNKHVIYNAVAIQSMIDIMSLASAVQMNQFVTGIRNRYLNAFYSHPAKLCTRSYIILLYFWAFPTYSYVVF